MTQEEKLQQMRELFSSLITIAEAKGHDYSGTEDAMSNLRDFGWQGVVVRLGDKYHRLKNFCKQGELKVKDENIVDTFKDLIVYGALGLMMYREERDEQRQADNHSSRD